MIQLTYKETKSSENRICQHSGCNEVIAKGDIYWYRCKPVLNHTWVTHSFICLSCGDKDIDTRDNIVKLTYQYRNPPLRSVGEIAGDITKLEQYRATKVVTFGIVNKQISKADIDISVLKAELAQAKRSDKVDEVMETMVSGLSLSLGPKLARAAVFGPKGDDAVDALKFALYTIPGALKGKAHHCERCPCACSGDHCIYFKG